VRIGPQIAPERTQPGIGRLSLRVETQAKNPSTNPTSSSTEDWLRSNQ
jgi:hypothetical protein